ncbi:NFX1-type zinc finger-containing protein 1 [Lampetra planeri]
MAWQGPTRPWRGGGRARGGGRGHRGGRGRGWGPPTSSPIASDASDKSSAWPSQCSLWGEDQTNVGLERGCPEKPFVMQPPAQRRWWPGESAKTGPLATTDEWPCLSRNNTCPDHTRRRRGDGPGRYNSSGGSSSREDRDLSLEALGRGTSGKAPQRGPRWQDDGDGGGGGGGGGGGRTWGGSPRDINDRGPRTFQERAMGTRALWDLLEKEPSEIVMRLASPICGLRPLLQKMEMQRDVLVLLVQVLAKACACQGNRKSLQHMLSTVKESPFFRRVLPFFVVQMKLENAPEKLGKLSAQIADILVLLSTIIGTFPASAIADVSLLLSAVEGSVNYLKLCGVALDAKAEKAYEELKKLTDFLLNKKREGNLRSDAAALRGDPSSRPPEDFHTLSIYPTYADIHEKAEPFIRANVVRGGYPDVATYLDTQFRLLREDFLRPLREGIAELLSVAGREQQQQQRRRRYDDIRVYHDVRLVSPSCSSVGIIHNVSFDVRPLRSVRWDNSKRLLFGSLVCLSRDNFDSMLFASVANRGCEDLRQGLVSLCFSKESRRELPDVKPSDVFLMVETTAYFEAYRHVLEGLQEAEEVDFPFRRYIVECQKDVEPPDYLATLPRPKYDFSPALHTELPDDSYLHLLEPRPMVDVVDARQWPSADDLRLDESQAEALRLALSRELAIIQGPPGTGKTYVGLKIAQLLLHNAPVWQKGQPSPVLVVCYTNHALDQFLEGIARFEKDLVRVGGRSASDVMKKFSLKELRNSADFRRKIPPHLRTTFSAISQDMRRLRQRIEQEAAHLRAAQQGVLRERVLQPCIASDHLAQLMARPQEKAGGRRAPGRQSSRILEWLGIGGSVAEAALSVETLLEESDDVIEETSTDPSDDEGEWMGSGHLLASEKHGAAAATAAAAAAAATKADKHGRGGTRRERPPPTEHRERPHERGDRPPGRSDERRREAVATEDGIGVSDGSDEGDLIRVSGEAELIQDSRLMEDDMEAARGRGVDGEAQWLAQLQRNIMAMSLQDDEQGAQQAEQKHRARDGGGWQVVCNPKRQRHAARRELRKTSCMTQEEEANVHDIWALTLPQRWQLYRRWVQKYQAEIRWQIQTHESEYQTGAERLADVREEEELAILRQARVIGMTTTGAAKYRHTLQKIRPRIVIVEEAAEVLEAHIVTTLSPGCQHLILIGDHQQLRPSATVYELATHFHLEVSLFERLVRNGLPFVKLQYQHRMRPEIARLLVPHIYTELRDHPSVLEYEDIKGMGTNLYFVEHSELEEEVADSRSRHNRHEARFVVALCRYLILQGYRPAQITVLTMYAGQLLALRRMMPRDPFQGVRVCVVDKYQGEENDIVLLSLVRSNAEGRPGFLRNENRACVALSRAKRGLYVVGNAAMLAATVPLWARLLRALRSEGRAGEGLLLRCQAHPDREVVAARDCDFRRAPEGGCTLPCEFRLQCGHVCTRACHPYDPEHVEFLCLKPCQKVLCALGHRCPKACWEKCGECEVPLEKKIPRCGHAQRVPCHVPPEEFACQVPCRKTLRCGHRCRRACGVACESKCKETVEAELPCAHRKEVACHADPAAVACYAPCPAALDCGHPCRGSCCECHEQRFHKECAQPCQRALVCGHRCREPCTRDCPPCALPCENRCVHSRCRRPCGETCAPCVEPCEWRCPHRACGRLCHEPCDRGPCDRPCELPLRCGHPCAGLCGEPCPDKCRACDGAELAEIFFGSEDEPSARFVQLEDCKHVLEASGLDRWMSQDEEGKEGDATSIRLKVCPKCRTPIRRNLRYGNVVKKTLRDIEEVKRRMRGGDKSATRGQIVLLQDKFRRNHSMILYYYKETNKLQEMLDGNDASPSRLHTLENVIVMFQKVTELKLQLETHSVAAAERSRRVDGRLKEFLGWLVQPRSRLGEQELRDLQTELLRLTMLAELWCRYQRVAAAGAGGSGGGVVAGTLADAQDALRLLEARGRFSAEREAAVKALMARVRQRLPLSGLGVSEGERVDIVKAMGLAQGHWFKCSRGHVYAIGECGGAMERAHCPECGDVIGGVNHLLERGNALASEMDGARHAAWSDTANDMMNYRDLLRLQFQ